MTIVEVLEFLIQKGPGRTEQQLAEAIFGEGAEQQRVNQDCRSLLGKGSVIRRGSGGPVEPYRYYPAE